MKSKISLCNKTVLLKDILRFAPLWGLYLAGGLLVMHSSTKHMLSDTLAISLSYRIGAMSVANLIYGALCALLLFGELFDVRRCRTLHATPVRRETWFSTHVLAGLSFSLLPNLIMALTLMPRLEGYWPDALLWLLGVELEFLFFFGLAMFCVMLAGNRFAAVAIYGILNFGALLIQWFVPTLYEPLLYGVELDLDILTVFCPVIYLCGRTTVIYSSNWLSSTFVRKTYGWPVGSVFEGIEKSWQYLVILAVLGIALGTAALLLYRRRNLERAGDALTVKALEPVFVVAFSLFVGGLLAFLGSLYANYLLFLAVGLLLGWIAAQMLIQRTVRIFRLRSFVGFALLVAILASTFAITKADPLNVSGWLPDAAQVESVTIDYDIGFYSFDYPKPITLAQKDNIQEVIELHEDVMEDRLPIPWKDKTETVRFIYRMQNGMTVSRQYAVNSEMKVLLKKFYSKAEYVLGYTDWEEYIQKPHYIQISERGLRGEDAKSLLKAIKADCEAGYMAQKWTYHYCDEQYTLYIDFVYGGPGGIKLLVYADAKNTIAWIEANT